MKRTGDVEVADIVASPLMKGFERLHLSYRRLSWCDLGQSGRRADRLS